MIVLGFDSLEEGLDLCVIAMIAYNGNANATLTSVNFALTGLVGSEGFDVTQTSGTYNSQNVLSANTATASLAKSSAT